MMASENFEPYVNQEVVACRQVNLYLRAVW